MKASLRSAHVTACWCRQSWPRSVFVQREIACCVIVLKRLARQIAWRKYIIATIKFERVLSEAGKLVDRRPRFRIHVANVAILANGCVYRFKRNCRSCTAPYVLPEGGREENDLFSCGLILDCDNLKAAKADLGRRLFSMNYYSYDFSQPQQPTAQLPSVKCEWSVWSTKARPQTRYTRHKTQDTRYKIQRRKQKQRIKNPSRERPSSLNDNFVTNRET